MKNVKKIVPRTSKLLRGFTKNKEYYFCMMSIIRLNVTTGLVRSLEYTLMCFSRGPFFPVVSTLALICPTAPESR